jgi:Uma2 family endonuclease
MVQTPAKPLTLAEFLDLPETKPAGEYVDGKIILKPMPQGKHSTLQMQLGTAINQRSLPEKLAYAFPELRCTFGEQSLVPDIAVFEWDRIPRDETGEVANRVTIPPDWVIEILSPAQSSALVIDKVLFCLNQGTQLGWVIDLRVKLIIVFLPERLPQVKRKGDLLPVLPSLSDWALSVNEVFQWLIV